MHLDLPGLFEEAFGYRTPAFAPRFDPHTSDRQSVSLLGSPYYANDAMGREYYMPVTLTYNDAATEGGQKWDLPYPVVAISSRKTIFETQLTERRGTVKELVNTEDYLISIKGFLTGRDGLFPEEDITRLRQLFETNEPISISCVLTDIFLLRPDRQGSDKVVIRDMKLPQISGVKNIRPYELVLVSDEPFNLITDAGIE